MNLKKLRMHERAHTVWSKLYKILANAEEMIDAQYHYFATPDE